MQVQLLLSKYFFYSSKFLKIEVNVMLEHFHDFMYVDLTSYSLRVHLIMKSVHTVCIM